MGKSTSKQPRFSAYIPPELLEFLQREARRNRRSMNNQLVWYLEQERDRVSGEVGSDVLLAKNGDVRVIPNISPDTMKRS